MKTLTVKSITKAIESGAKSISAIARAHGVKGNPSGKVCKDIRRIQPEVAEMLKAKKAGKPITKKTAQLTVIDKAECINPFRANSQVGIVFSVGATAKPHPLSEVIDKAVAKMKPLFESKYQKEVETYESLKQIHGCDKYGTVQFKEKNPKYKKGVEEGTSKTRKVKVELPKRLTEEVKHRRVRWIYTMIQSEVHPNNKGKARSVETDMTGQPILNRKLKDNVKLVRFERAA